MIYDINEKMNKLENLTQNKNQNFLVQIFLFFQIKKIGVNFFSFFE